MLTEMMYINHGSSSVRAIFCGQVVLTNLGCIDHVNAAVLDLGRTLTEELQHVFDLIKRGQHSLQFFIIIVIIIIVFIYYC